MLRSTGAGRRVRVDRGDILVLGGYEISADVLRDIVVPADDRRLLWAFVRKRDRREVQPICFSEDRVIWLQDEDLVRAPGDEV